MRTIDDSAVLDDPVGASLRGHHTHLARRGGRVLAYRSSVASFSALPSSPTDQDWADLATLLGPAGIADLFSSTASPPSSWEQVFSLAGLQMVADPGRFTDGAPDPDVVELGAADVPEMLDLVARTRPGPFWAETHLLGRYVGIRRDGTLVAMAGERLHPPGWTEISAVCTAPEARGDGLATRLVRDVAAQVVARGECPFLHVTAANTGAIEVYQRLGFDVRRDVTFRGYRTPQG